MMIMIIRHNYTFFETIFFNNYCKLQAWHSQIPNFNAQCAFCKEAWQYLSKHVAKSGAYSSTNLHK